MLSEFLKDGSVILKNEPLRKHTTMGIGGNADYFVKVNSLKGLKEVTEYALNRKIKTFVIGNGSNLIVSDSGFRGIIISIKNLNRIYVTGSRARVFAGADLNKTINYLENKGLYGLESFCGIPSSVGGAVTMNAGAFGKRIGDFILSVETLADGKLNKYDKEDCRFGYRKSRFITGKETVYAVTFVLSDKKSETKAEILKKRAEKQPKGRTCGSVFKNPDGDFAGRLIEEAGLKGEKIGGAQISVKHANFIINDGSATARDVVSLIKLAKKRVKELFGVDLKEEVRYLGEF